MRKFLAMWFSVWIVRVVWGDKKVCHFAWTEQGAIDWLLQYEHVDAKGVALNCATNKVLKLATLTTAR